jgi:prepilin-type N-terminal cleavage/methylation domain-containing protein
LANEPSARREDAMMRNRQSSPHRRIGFTLFELLVTLSIIAIVAAMVAPAFSDGDRLHLMAGASVMTSDIELAQVMTIADPSRPVVVRFDVGRSRYWLAYSDTPDAPIARADTGAPYLVVLGEDRASGAAGVTFTVTGLSQPILTFNGQGGLQDFISTPQITLSLNGKTITVAIAATTGTVSQTSG